MEKYVAAFFARVLKETNLKEHFTEHDLRAKVDSDAQTLKNFKRPSARAH